MGRIAQLEAEIYGVRCELERRSDERDRLAAVIREHNAGCDSACGKTTTHEHVRRSRNCDGRRDCPDCPRYWRIEGAL